jgi:hypothetical protein
MGEVSIRLDAAQVVAKLTEKAAEFRSIKNRLSHFSDGDPHVVHLRMQALELLSRGQLQQADLKLAEAESYDLAAIGDLESILRGKRVSAAQSRAERGALARLRWNADSYREAANALCGSGKCCRLGRRRCRATV